MGLAAALRWLVDRFHDQDRPTLSLEIRGEPCTLPPEVETTLFRIAQEGLTNAIKHAHASHIWVALDYDDGPSLSVRDDGIGFTPAEEIDPGGMRTAWGLRGMQERASLIYAVLTVESSPGAGATFTVRLNSNQSLEVSYGDQSAHH
jgi:two-component system NarL family sensor kinase